MNRDGIEKSLCFFDFFFYSFFILFFPFFQVIFLVCSCAHAEIGSESSLSLLYARVSRWCLPLRARKRQVVPCSLIIILRLHRTSYWIRPQSRNRKHSSCGEAGTSHGWLAELVLTTWLKIPTSISEIFFRVRVECVILAIANQKGFPSLKGHHREREVDVNTSNICLTLKQQPQ